MNIAVVVLLVCYFIFTSSENSHCRNVIKFFSSNHSNVLIKASSAKTGWNILEIILLFEQDINYNQRLKFLKSIKETENDILNGADIYYQFLLPKNELPIVKSILFNRQNICFEPQEHENSVLLKHKFFNNHSKILDVNSILIRNIRKREIRNAQWLKQLPFQCGKRPIKMEMNFKSTPLILGGVHVRPGEFPWLVYLRYFDWRILCGATLISSKFVVTAAHCVHNRKLTEIHFGKHNRFAQEPGSIIRQPKEIITHPEYRFQAHADIALIQFDPIEFTETILPICIYPFGSQLDQQLIHGIVAGWGIFIEDSDESSATPMKASISKVTLEMCHNSHARFKTLASQHTFCAGGNFSGPCHGDSGSGFYFRYQNTWYLRGIISHSLRQLYSDNCLTNYYAVYVDIIYYIDWLKQYLISEKKSEVEIISNQNDNDFNDAVQFLHKYIENKNKFKKITSNWKDSFKKYFNFS